MAERIVKKVVIEVDDKGSLKKTGKDSQTLNRNMKGLSQQSSNASKNFSKQAQGMQGVLVPAYAEVAARVFALSAAYQALSKAADFRILIQGQAEYAKRTGKNMADIAKQVQKASKNMLGFQDASSAVALATTSGISSGQIVKMTKAAVDSSTALGRSVTDTMDRLTRGIVKAEPEILDEIGVIIRLDQVYKDYAESVKKSTAELSEGEKATARYNAIMGQLETKFGGISDNVDPNYMRAAAAAVMDVVAKASSEILRVFNPILKFLSETKEVIVVILAVIVKTLAGKIFPAFESFGKRIAAYPAKMGDNVQKLTAKVQKMNAEIVKARNLSVNAGVALDKANDPKFRGAAYRTGATTRSQQMTNLRSMRATNIRMSSALGTGDTASYKGQAFTRKMLEKRIADEMRLRSEIGKTHKQSEVYWKKATANATRFNRAMAQTKMLFASAAKSATMYFSKTKSLIADHGIIKGTIRSVKILQRQWLMAGKAAGFYQKALKGVTAATATLGVVAAAAAAAVNALFGIIMWLTLIVSLGKMILNIFVDFDTPFKRAADAAKTLNDELKEQETLFSQKDSVINFDNAATSFDEAMQQAQFADNFASSLYESTSKAMKALSAEMGEMGFWEGTFDWMKSLFGMGSLDYQMKALRKNLSLTASGPGGSEIISEITAKYLEQASLSLTRSWNDAETAKWNTANAGPNAKPGVVKKAMEAATAAGKANPSIKIARTMEDFLTSPFFQDLTDDAQQSKLLEIYTDLNTAQKKAAETAKALGLDITAIVTDFEALSKASTKFTDALVVKTAAHDAAMQHEKLIKMFTGTSVPNQTKVLALQKQGLLPDNIDQTALIAAQDAGDQTATMLEALEIYSKIDDKIEDILGKSAHWVTLNEDLLRATNDTLLTQLDLHKANVYGGDSFKTSYLKNKLKEIKINEDLERFYILEAEYKELGNKATAADDLRYYQAKYGIWNDMAKMTFGQNEGLNTYQKTSRAMGRRTTLAGKYQRKEKDLSYEYNQFMRQATRTGQDRKEIEVILGNFEELKKLLNDTKIQEYKETAHSILDSVAISIANINIAVNDTVETLKTALEMRTFRERLNEMGVGKYMDTSKVSDEKLVRMFTKHGHAEERALPGKIKAATLEIQKLELEQQYRGESKGMLEFRKKVAEIEMNTATEWVKQEEKRLALAVAIKKARGELRSAQLEQDLGWLRDSIQTIGDAFGNSIKGAFNDIFMNKGFSMDKFRTTLAQGFATAASTNIGNVAQNAVFGNKGFLANALRKTPLEPFIDDLFPKSQLEVAKDQLKELEKQTLIMTGGGLTSKLFSTKGDAPAPNAQGALVDFLAYFASKAFGLANGGYAKGGFRAFANGGMVNKPTLGLLGEGKYNEAVVPLPDGKSIPIKGSTGDVTVNVTIDSDGSSQVEADGGESAKKLGYMVSQAVQSELVAQQRPGGLLNSYG